MHSEPVTLSPLEFPVVWLAFLLQWTSVLICAYLGFRLWRATSQKWWLLIGAAFAFSICSLLIQSLRMGVPPLPVGYRDPESVIETSNEFSTTMVDSILISYQWDFVTPVIAIALWLAYRAQCDNQANNKKRRRQPSVQTRKDL